MVLRTRFNLSGGRGASCDADLLVVPEPNRPLVATAAPWRPARYTLSPLAMFCDDMSSMVTCLPGSHGAGACRRTAQG